MPFQGHQHGYMMSSGGGFARFVLFMIFLLIVGAIALAIVRYVSQGHDSHRHSDHHRGSVPTPPGPLGPPPIAPTPSADSALDVLRMRFARGEIDEDDFNRRVIVLQGSN